MTSSQISHTEVGFNLITRKQHNTQKHERTKVTRQIQKQTNTKQDK